MPTAARRFAWNISRLRAHQSEPALLVPSLVLMAAVAYVVLARVVIVHILKSAFALSFAPFMGAKVFHYRIMALARAKTLHVLSANRCALLAESPRYGFPFSTISTHRQSFLMSH